MNFSPGALGPLPQEVFREVLYYYPPEDILDLCQSNSLEVCFDDNFWREKTQQDFPNAVQEYPALSANMSWREFYRAKATGKTIIPVYGYQDTFVAVTPQTQVANVYDQIRDRVRVPQRGVRVSFQTRDKKINGGRIGGSRTMDIIPISISLVTKFDKPPFSTVQYIQIE